ncbi:MAG: hypothetical protein ACT4QB_23085 [Gammaproteobacteria bacterium]
MLFLIEYDRAGGTIVDFVTFTASGRTAAENSRIEMELRLNRKSIDHEVLLLEAASEAALRKTHRRYFQNADEIGESLENLASDA